MNLLEDTGFQTNIFGCVILWCSAWHSGKKCLWLPSMLLWGFSLINIYVWKEGNVLFNDALNTFYLRLYGIGYMVSDIWLRTILIVRKETRCHHIGYSFQLTARVLLYAPFHRQDSTYHSLCYTSRGHWLEREIAQWVHPMKDRSDDPSHHEQTLLPRSYICICLMLI